MLLTEQFISRLNDNYMIDEVLNEIATSGDIKMPLVIMCHCGHVG